MHTCRHTCHTTPPPTHTAIQICTHMYVLYVETIIMYTYVCTVCVETICTQIHTEYTRNSWCIRQSVCVCRHWLTRSTPQPVMCGVMAVCCMRCGAWERSHFRDCQYRRCAKCNVLCISWVHVSPLQFTKGKCGRSSSLVDLSNSLLCAQSWWRMWGLIEKN